MMLHISVYYNLHYYMEDSNCAELNINIITISNIMRKVLSSLFSTVILEKQHIQEEGSQRNKGDQEVCTKSNGDEGR